MVAMIRVSRLGGPEVLETVDAPLPPPGKGEVQIRHKAIGLNYIDTYYRTGLYPPPSLPYVPGGEAAGVVTALGEGVAGFRRGDRVAYAMGFGGYSEARNIAATSLVKIPAGIDFDIAASALLKGLTAEYLLFRTFPLKKGHVALIHAAAGGTGQILVQWAKALGAVVIATVGSDEKVKLAKKLGADHVINYAKEDFPARVKAITGGTLCNVVYDGVGKATFPASLDCIRPFGTFVSFGNASGAVEAFDIGLLARKGSLYAVRPTLGTYVADPDRFRAMARRLFGALKRGDVKIAPPNRFPLARAGDAHRALEGRQTTGSTILVPPEA